MIYEEPSTMNIDATDKAVTHNCYNTYDKVAFSRESTPVSAINSISPPDLPVKVGKKSIDVNAKHDYDIPKSTKQPENHDESEQIINCKQKSEECSSVNVSEVKAILSSKNIQISPKRHEDKKPIKVNIREQNILPAKEHRTPVKSWFMKHMHKGEKSSKSAKLLTKLSDKSNHVQASDGSSCENISKTMKGGKVNMIISQLEANGHLHLLAKSLIDRKSMCCDSEDYETVTIKDSKIIK